MNSIREILGKNIKTLRESRGWTQADLARKTDISPAFLMHIERGTRGVSLESIELLASALEVNIARLFETIEGDPHFVDLLLPPGMKLEKDLKNDINSAVAKYLAKIRETSPVE